MISRYAESVTSWIGENRWHLSILAYVALVLTLLYWHAREAPFLAERINAHDLIIDGVARSPYQYRLLGPFVAEAVRGFLEIFLTARYAFHGAYLVWNYISIGSLLIATWALARDRIGPSLGLLAGIVLTIPLMVSYVEQPYAPWSFIEPVFLVLGILLLERGRNGLFIGVTVLATLNRETGLFLPLTALALSFVLAPGSHWRSHLRVGLYALGAWGCTYGSIRLVRGPADPILSMSEIVTGNLQPEQLVWTALYITVFLGPFWFLWLRGLKRADPYLRAASWIAVPLLALYLVFGLWREVRILLPLAPIAIVTGLLALREER